MPESRITSLEKLLDGPRDGALLRYALGNAYLEASRLAEAVAQLRVATERDPTYTAAWKQLGKALAANGEQRAALDTYTQGIEVAQARGDVQAAKEMTVFSRRLAQQAERGESDPPAPTGKPTP